MNWTELVKGLTTQGYNGGASNFGAVQTHLADGGHSTTTVTTKSGTVCDLREMFGEYEREQDIEDGVNDRLAAIERATGIDRPNGIKAREHNHRVDISAVKPLTIDADKLAEERGWKMWAPTAPQDFDNLNDGGWQHMGEFLFAIASAKNGRGFDKRLAEDLDRKASQQEDVDSLGGFLVPDQFEAQIIATGMGEAQFLAQRFNINANRKHLIIPRFNDRDQSSTEIAGLGLAGTAELADPGDDTLDFGSITLTMHKKQKIVRVSNELQQDSAVNVGQAINQAFGHLVSMLQQRDYLVGTGAGQPLGLLNAAALHTVADTSTVSTLDKPVDLFNMVSTLEPGAVAGGLWIIHRGVLAALFASVVENAGATAGGPAFLGTSFSGPAPQQLLGFPMHFSGFCKALNTKGDMFLTDPSKYVYAMSRMAVDVSPHRHFDTDETAFRLTLRDAGQPIYGAVLTDPQSATQSAYITLDTRT